ncbi:bifunctional phosphatase PAP2/diacylglycerol kinase family protein [Microbacterium hydrocarbonoxydans]|uniref:bifunctional phosphatase PAP2/diacylglycerol kinase family protein n=1 Tax=Microbacterium hydrocarbonoxydans TaxID=273678 RepID=UPI0007BB8A64|nr:phosphatase PAP2 family protein [Microbacterium hydrocarbonoxydans]GAT73134.1 possible diacylglycerol kinase [Microbacterium sp. HM58-2]
MGLLAHPRILIRRASILPRWVRRIDARVAGMINGHRHLPSLDRRLAQLSHLADRSRLWLAVAFTLVILGGAARRGAVRGIASLVAGSAIANLIGKRIFGGDRPLLKDVPVPRRLKSFPTSASFPSGHSASAAAFVTGVALESRRAGLALAPLGAAVAYSRLHTGAHWLSDVVGGAALGAAVAGAGRMLVPARPAPADEPTVPRVVLPALADGGGASVLINPSSGIDPFRPDPVEFLTEALPGAELHVLDQGDHVAAIVREALASDSPPRVLGIWGGDGSVASVADVARRARIPLLAFPGGTFNHFARTVGTATLEQGIEAIRSGSGCRVDVAELAIDESEPITVLNAASIGIYPEFVAARESMEKKLGKPLAALIAAIKALSRAETIAVRIDGRPALVWSVAVAVGESRSPATVPLQRRRLDDAVLDVRVLHAPGRMSRLRGLVALALGMRSSAVLDRVPGRGRPPTIEAFTASSVRIEARAAGQALTIAHDGEVTLSAPLGPDHGAAATITIVPGGLDVYSAASEGGVSHEGRALVRGSA